MNDPVCLHVCIISLATKIKRHQEDAVRRGHQRLSFHGVVEEIKYSDIYLNIIVHFSADQTINMGSSLFWQTGSILMYFPFSLSKINPSYPSFLPENIYLSCRMAILVSFSHEQHCKDSPRQNVTKAHDKDPKMQD